MIARYLIPMTIPKGTLFHQYIDRADIMSLNKGDVESLNEDTDVLYLDEVTMIQETPRYLHECTIQYIMDNYKGMTYPILADEDVPTIMGNVNASPASGDVVSIRDLTTSARKKDRYVSFNGVIWHCGEDSSTRYE